MYRTEKHITCLLDVSEKANPVYIYAVYLRQKKIAITLFVYIILCISRFAKYNLILDMYNNVDDISTVDLPILEHFCTNIVKFDRMQLKHLEIVQTHPITQ